MKEKYRELITVFSLILIDLAMFYLGLTLAYYSRIFALHFVESYLREFYPRFPLVFPFSHLLSFWWMPVVFLITFTYENLYSDRYPFWEEAKLLIKADLLSVLSISGILFLGHLTSRTSAVAILFLFFYGIFLFPLGRYIGKRLLSKMNLWNHRTLIIGAGVVGQQAAAGLIKEKHMGYSIIGFLDDDPNKSGKTVRIDNTDYPIIGNITDAEKIIQTLGVELAVVAIPSLKKEKYLTLTQKIQKITRKLFVVPDIQGVALLNTKLLYLFMQETMLLNIKNNLHSSWNQFIKRVFDLTISLLLVPFLVPLFIIIGFLIKIESRGNVFYFQQRIGRRGEKIKIFKFRTMFQDADAKLEEILQNDPAAREEWEKYQKLKNDPRVTRIGKILRYTSLDELPQIINVIKGDMSLVGPRPALEEQIENFYKDNKDYYYLTRPGITGLWQISGRNQLNFESRVRLETWYVLNWSLWLDIIILIRTISVVLKREGAY
ncbi:MAG: undecaprenyl-phosphate galactose phosphotransferase WbaP [Calditrichia bacterium]